MSDPLFSLQAVSSLTRKPKRRKDSDAKFAVGSLAAECLEVRQVMSAVAVAVLTDGKVAEIDSTDDVDSVASLEADDAFADYESADDNGVTNSQGVSLPSGDIEVLATEDSATDDLAIDLVFEDFNPDDLNGNVEQSHGTTPVTNSSVVAIDITLPVLHGPFLPELTDETNGSSESVPSSQSEVVIDIASNGGDINTIDDVKALIAKVNAEHDSKVEVITRSAANERIALEAAAAVRITTVQQEGRDLLGQATAQYDQAVLSADKVAAVSIAAVVETVNSGVRAAETVATNRAAQELAKRNAEVNRQTTLAQQKLQSEITNRDRAVQQKLNDAASQLRVASSKANRETQAAEARRDAEIRGARSWADKAISSLPRWARGLARYLRPIINKLEAAVDKAVSAAKSAVKGIQNTLKFARDSILRARDQVVNTIRNAASTAMTTILKTRDQLVSGAHKVYESASKAILQARDHMVAAARHEGESIVRIAQDARNQAVAAANSNRIELQTQINAATSSGVSFVQREVATRLEQLANGAEKRVSDVWVTTRNELTRITHRTVSLAMEQVTTTVELGEGIVDEVQSAGKDFVKRASEAKSPQDLVAAARGFVSDVSNGILKESGETALKVAMDVLFPVVSIIADALVPDVVIRELMRSNPELFLDRNAKPDASLNSQLGGAPFYYINGMDTKRQGSNFGSQEQDLVADGQAMEQAEGLSMKLGREVRLIWNATQGAGIDSLEALLDRLQPTMMPQTNPATRQLAGILLTHAERGEQVSLCAHSQGNLIAHNALRILHDMGYETWVRNQVRWVGVGSPVMPVEVSIPVHYTRIVNQGDPINFISEAQDLEADSGHRIGTPEHNMIRSYMAYVEPAMFWSANNDYESGTIPQGANSDRYAKFQSLWTARAGMKPIITRADFGLL